MASQTLVGFGHETLWSTPDAESWTSHTTPFQEVAGARIKAMANSATRAIAVGGVGREIDGWGEVMFTDQAKVAVGTVALEGWGELTDLPVPGFASTIAYASEMKRFVAGADIEYGPEDPEVNPLKVAVSDDDGATWTAYDLPPKITGVKQVVWADALGLFILAGTVELSAAWPEVPLGGFGLLTSPDGETWSTPTLVDPLGEVIVEEFEAGWGIDLSGAGWAPEIGRAIAFGGRALWSTSDGSIWHLYEIPVTNFPPRLNAAAWSPDLAYFLLAGTEGATSS